MQGIFISYRRQDSQSAAGRLADHLKDHMGEVPIFRDMETIEPGVDFVDAINKALKSCGVLLAVIGPRWLTVTDPSGRRRLDDAHDYTRLEVAAALKREGVRVIPVLVEGAEMPGTDDLPEDLKSLSRRNAIELTDKRWDYDVSQLAETLRKALGVSPARTPTTQAGQSGTSASGPVTAQSTGDGRRKMGPLRWAGVALGALLVAGILSSLMEQDGGLDPYVVQQPVVNTQPQALARVEAEPTASINTGNQHQQTNTPSTQLSPPSQPATPNLSGVWIDSEGGQHQVAQRGNQIAIQGMSPDGYVAGRGQISGLSGWVEYTLNGYPLRASLELARDGASMRVVVTDPATGQRDVLTMTRVN